VQAYLLTQKGMKEVVVLNKRGEFQNLLEELQKEFHP
jgi:hypothetical protein